MNSATYLTAINNMHDTMFLGAFSKLEKVTISFIVCFSLSVYSSTWNDSVPTGRIFMEFDIRVFQNPLNNMDQALLN